MTRYSLVRYCVLLTLFLPLLHAADDPLPTDPTKFDPNSFLDSLNPPLNCDPTQNVAGYTPDPCKDFFGFMCQGKSGKLAKDLEERAASAKIVFSEKSDQILKARHAELTEQLKEVPEFSCLKNNALVDSTCAQNTRKAISSIAGNRLLGDVLKEPFAITTSLPSTQIVEFISKPG